jgi:hypothetical protein
MVRLVTFIYPDGTSVEEEVEALPEVGGRIGALTVARVETKEPDDEIDTATWVYLKKTEE